GVLLHNAHLRSFGTCSRATPECGARVASCGERLWNRSPRETKEKPPSGHYDPDARSFAATEPNLPKRKWRQAPAREARHRSPKSPRCERREAGVPRMGTRGASLGAWPAPIVQAQPVPRKHRNVSRRSATPKFGWARRKKQNPGAKPRRGNEKGCVQDGERSPAPSVRPHPEERAGSTGTANSSVRASRRMRTGCALMLRDASQRSVAVERPVLAPRCDAPQHEGEAAPAFVARPIGAQRNASAQARGTRP